MARLEDEGAVRRVLVTAVGRDTPPRGLAAAVGRAEAEEAGRVEGAEEAAEGAAEGAGAGAALAGADPRAASMRGRTVPREAGLSFDVRSMTVL